MHILRKQAIIPPLPLLVTHLNGPCSSMAYAQSSREDCLYLVVGKTTGEAIFFPISRNEAVVRFESDIKLPITAIADGALRNKESKEIVTIQANGLIQCLDFPADGEGPVRTFCQQIYANVSSCRVLDIDGDKQNELLVFLTDRVVRSYRYHEETDRLEPLNKWEMPAQISGWCLSSNGKASSLLLSQSDQAQYVSIDFGPGKEVRVERSIINETDRPQLMLALRPQAADLAHCLAERLIIANVECQTEWELRNVGVDICCAGALTLDNGLNVIVTLDPKGLLCVYGWAKGVLQTVEPIARCDVLTDAVFLSLYPYRQRENAVVVAVINVFNRAAVYLVDLGHVVAVASP